MCLCVQVRILGMRPGYRQYAVRWNRDRLPAEPRYLESMQLEVMKDVTQCSSETLLAGASFLRSTSNDHIVKCSGVVDEPCCKALVLEYCERGTLRHVVGDMLSKVRLVCISFCIITYASSQQPPELLEYEAAMQHVAEPQRVLHITVVVRVVTNACVAACAVIFLCPAAV